MSINPDLQRAVDNFEAAGYDCTPEGHERKRCACGYDGPPSFVIPYDEVEEFDYDQPMYVCPGCGDA